MGKFYSVTDVFKFTWEQVATGFWLRYPNPNSKHVLTEDVISRHIDENDNLITCRIITKTNKIPKWTERIIGGESQVLILEESVVDVKGQTLTTYTRNIGMKKFMSLEEKCVYRVSPDNSGWTQCQKSAWVLSSCYGLKKPVEALGVQRYKGNAQKAFQGFDYVLTGLFKTDVLKEHPLVMSSKIKDTAKDTARKAAELAKSKTPHLLNRAS